MQLHAVYIQNKRKKQALVEDGMYYYVSDSSYKERPWQKREIAQLIRYWR